DDGDVALEAVGEGGADLWGGDVVGGGDDDPVHALAGQLVQHVLEPGAAVAQVVEDDAEAACLGGRRDRLGEGAVEGLGDVADEESNEAGAPGPQTAGDGVRRVLQVRDRRPHTLEGTRGDPVRLVEHPGDGGAGDPGAAGDVEDRCGGFPSRDHGAIISGRG